MELAQRIRQARLEAGLTQKQICGDTITRNMLSQIENGSATPSLATLQYLARQLGKSVSYLLGEPPQALTGTPQLAQAREAYRAGAFPQALSLLGQCQPDETVAEEWHLLQYLATLEQARREQSQGRIPNARRLLESLEEIHGLYVSKALRLERLRLLALCGDTEPLPPDDLPLLLRARAALEAQEHDLAVLLLSAAQEQEDPQWQLLRGHADFARKLYATAAACYRRAEEAYPEEVIPLLETCYKELGDFQQAYVYAVKNRKE